MSFLFVARRTTMTVTALAMLVACGGDSTGPDELTPVASIAIGGVGDTLLLRQSASLRATPRDSTGQDLADRPVHWSTSDAAVLSISNGGVITALRGGSATVTATSGIISASKTIVARRLEFDRIYPGFEMSCGLEPAGDAWCWGSIGREGSGNGSLDRTVSPIPLPAARGSRFESLALGANFACGVRVGGDVVCWGGNDQGQLGDGTTADRGAPVIAPVGSGATSVTAGLRHACALLATGTARCWGANGSGQLGDGSRVTSPGPVQVKDLPIATSINAGAGHTCAVAGGRPLCWGNDESGQLGHDTTYTKPVPSRAGSVAGFSPAYSAITASDAHTCGLTTAGSAYCWGRLESAGLPIDNDLSPVGKAPGHQFTKLIDGWTVQCGLEADGQLWCWGADFSATRFPVNAHLVDAAVAYADVCALDGAGIAYCWNPRSGSDSPPVTVTGVPVLTSIAGGSTRVCGLGEAGELWCWQPAPTAPDLVWSGERLVSIWDGSIRVCALTASYETWCYTRFGLEREAPGHSFIAIGSGRDYECGLTSASTVWCWGVNQLGQLGDGTYTSRQTPAQVSGTHQFTSISAGDHHACALTAAREAYCWGRASHGQMGDGNGSDSPSPVPVDGSPTVTALAVGAGYLSCALEPAGTALCWPVAAAQNGTHTVTAPAPLVELSTGASHACGLDAGGGAFCWGGNSYGGFGNGQTGSRGEWIPQPVSGGIQFSTIAAGGSTTCGISTVGTAYCWGANEQGNVGSPDGAGAGVVGFPVKLYGQE